MDLKTEAELVQFISTTLSEKCFIEQAAVQYEKIKDKIDKREKEIIDKARIRKKELLKQLEQGKKIFELKKAMGELVDILDENGEEFSAQEVVDECFDSLSQSINNAFVVNRDNLLKCFEEITNASLITRNTIFKAVNDDIRIGKLDQIQEKSKLVMGLRPAGRGRGRIIPGLTTPKRALSMLGIQPENLAFVESSSENTKRSDSITGSIGSEPTSPTMSEDSFANRPIRPEPSPEPKRNCIFGQSFDIRPSHESTRLKNDTSFTQNSKISQTFQNMKLSSKTVGLNPAAKAFNPFDSSNHIPKEPSGSLDITKINSVDMICEINGNFNKPMGISMSEQDMIVCDSVNHKVQIYTEMGKHLKTIGGFSMPTVAVRHRNEIFIKDNKNIQVFDQDYNYKRDFGKEKISKMSCGIMIHKDRLRVIIHDYKIANFSVETGEFIEERTVDWITAVHATPRVRFARNRQEHMYLADMANFCILVSDSNGQVIKVIGDGKGNGPSKFSQPAGITLDDYGNVIVADSKNNRILLFSRDGKALGELKTKIRWSRPSDCHLDKNRLSIVGLNGKAYIFRIK